MRKSLFLISMLLATNALAFDPAKAPRYPSPDMYRPNVDRIIINGPGSTGPVDGMTVAPTLSAVDGTLARLFAWLSGINTVADLRANPRGTFFKSAHTLGYYAAGDGGGASYRYDLTDTTSTDNGCSVIVGSDGTRWKLDWKTTIDLRQCGARGDDSDDTASVQSAINVAANTGANLFVPYGKVFKLVSTIDSAGKPINLSGAGVDPGNLGGTRGAGSWFHIAHTGIGFNIHDTGYAGKNVFENFGTFRDQPAPVNGTFTPLNADYDVVFSAAEGVVSMTMLNATKGLKITNNRGNRFWVKYLRGQFMQNAIFVERQNDKLRIDYVDAWPYWMNNDAVNGYTSANLDTVITQRADGLYGGYLFTIFAKSALSFGHYAGDDQGATGVSSEHHWDAVYADNARSFVVFDPDAQYTNAHIGWGTIFQDTFAVGATYAIQTNGAQNVALTIDDWKANNMRGGFAYIDGAGDKLNIGIFHEGTFNRSNIGTSGFVGINGAQVKIGNYLRASPVTTLYGTAPVPGVTGWSAPNGGASRTGGTGVFATLDAGYATSTTNAAGQFLLTHNAGQAPNDIQFGPSASCPQPRFSSISATQLGIQCLDTSGNPVANASVAFTYRVGVAGSSLPTSSN